MEHLKPSDAAGRLKFSGSAGDLLVPSIDAASLCGKAGATHFEKVMLSVEVNSDAYNRGLGIVLEGSPLMDKTASEDGLPSYVYNGYGISKDKKTNAVKFHPGMGGGQLRIEGVGGFQNQNLGFTPENWTDSHKRFHRLDVTLGKDGSNELCFHSESGRTWRKSWTRKLTDGRYIPAIYAWLDLGSHENPVYFGQISAIVHLKDLSPDVSISEPETVVASTVDLGSALNDQETNLSRSSNSAQDGDSAHKRKTDDGDGLLATIGPLVKDVLKKARGWF